MVFAAQSAMAATPYGRRLLSDTFAWPLTWCIWAFFLACGALLRLLFWAFDLQLEPHAALLWGVVACAAIVAGALAARYAQRSVTAELTWAGLGIFEIAAGMAIFGGTSLGMDPAALRALVLAPAALALCAYFGASVGLTVFPQGRLDVTLGYESLVGRRFLLSKASPVLSVVTSISVVGVSLGVWLVLVSLGILSGFEQDLTEKIIGANAHVVLQPLDHIAFDSDPDAQRALAQLPNVRAVAPVLEAEVAVASSSNYAGAQLFAIDPDKSPEVLQVLHQLVSGSLDALLADEQPAHNAAGSAADPTAFAAPAPLAHIALGLEMARSLNVKVGDRVRVISPALEVLTPVGVAPKSIGFRVAAIFSSKMYEYDARYVFVDLAGARRFLELGDKAISGYQLACYDPEFAPEVGARALAVVQRPTPEGKPAFEALDWKRRNQTLFAALKLERVVAFVVLVFIILVASFSIVNTLTMSVIEKRREIAILKTMGAHDGGILKLFLVQGLLVGALGTAVGTTLGVLTMLALGRFGFWIPGEVYYIDSLPVRLNALDVVLVVVAALMIVWDFAVYPALRGSKLQPVEGLRDG
jgi:lipoprotein-releasing system permease protein